MQVLPDVVATSTTSISLLDVLCDIYNHYVYLYKMKEWELIEENRFHRANKNSFTWMQKCSDKARTK